MFLYYWLAFLVFLGYKLQGENWLYERGILVVPPRDPKRQKVSDERMRWTMRKNPGQFECWMLHQTRIDERRAQNLFQRLTRPWRLTVNDNTHPELIYSDMHAERFLK
jgi:hypothetical protein